MKKTRIAFYLGRKSENSHSLLGDWLICWRTKSRFSHVELLAKHYPAPWGTSVKGKPYTGPLALMYSSSLRDDGVRGKTLTLVPGRWVVVEIDGDSTPALTYIKEREGTPYGWPDLFSFLVPFRVSTKWFFCSEIIAAAFGLKKPWKTSPGDLFDWAKAQPGFRVVPDDELYKEWQA